MSTSPEDYQASEQENESPDTGTEYNRATGEPEVTPHDRELAEEEADARNPNAGTSAGLEGDMGISSERTGPADETGTDGLGDLNDFEGTGTVGSARSSTHGSVPTARGGVPGAETEDTAGESNTAEVASHELHGRNPGHSGH